MSDQNIITYLRFKPSKNPSGYIDIDDIDPTVVNVTLPESFKADYVDNTRLNYSFTFNGALNMQCTQEEVFKKIGIPAIQNSLDGFNSTVFVYGQTGSGKTFTLTGGTERYADRGIIPRAISMIFHEIRNRSNVQIKISISYLQIYNEQAHDLLGSEDSASLEDLPKVKLLEDDKGGFHLKNLSVHEANNEEDALNLLFTGDTNRAVAETPMNLASSRSHCIFLIQMEVREHGSEKVRRSKLNLVDLAGSERIGKTSSSGAILREAKYINSSLFYLETVIAALHERATIGRSHIPYRNSLMTSVLRDSLGGNCKTIMVATISVEAAHTEESISTCRFAQRVSQIRNKVSVNEELDPFQLIKRLKNELLDLREQVAYLKGENGESEEFSNADIDDIRAACREYCANKDPNSTLNIGKITLSKMKVVFHILRQLVCEAEASKSGNEIQGSSNGNTGSTSSGIRKLSTKGTSSDLAAAEQTMLINELRATLVQRDKEIAILVNMVKQGKTADDVAMIAQGPTSSDGSRGSRVAADNRGPRRDGQDRKQEGSDNHDVSESASDSRAIQGREGDSKFRQVLDQQQYTQEQPERTLRSRLFGVPPPPSQEMFEDSAASFQWFQAHSSLRSAMESNTEALQQAITDAKTAGEKANKCRNTINYLKSSIESIRRERALDRISSPSPSFDAGESKGGDFEGGQDEESEQERRFRKEIDSNKIIYKESFELLRELKPKIEHIKKMIEKGRATMLQQYDQWYSYIHSQPQLIGSQEFNHLLLTVGGSKSPLGSFNDRNNFPRRGSTTNESKLDESFASPVMVTPSTYSKQSLGTSLHSRGKEAGPISDNSSISTYSEVNADIDAFYKAKDAILRTQRQQANEGAYSNVFRK